jgi:hypothetical protein
LKSYLRRADERRKFQKYCEDSGHLSGKLRYLRSYRCLFQYEDTNTNESGTTRPSMATRTGIHSTRPQASSPRPLTPLLKPHTSLWVVSPCEVGHRALPGIQRKDQPLA